MKCYVCDDIAFNNFYKQLSIEEHKMCPYANITIIIFLGVILCKVRAKVMPFPK
jgi:hypothetical protein